MEIRTPFGTFAAICRMIKIEHSVFALPYAWAGAFLAADGLPPLEPFILLTIAMVAVRSFAMGVNRIADLDQDRLNPRTRNRPLVTGEIGVGQTLAFCLLMAVIFILACRGINDVCLALSVPALLFSAGYSWAKRFTPLCHFWLGAVLGLAPLAGWLSVDPSGVGLPAAALFFAVTTWVGAFDIYYAFQDHGFDLMHGLHSAVTDYGRNAAFLLAGAAHVGTSAFLLLAGMAADLAWPWTVIWLGISAALFVEHRIISPTNLLRVNTAFFTLNGIVSPAMFLGVLLGIFCRGA